MSHLQFDVAQLEVASNLTGFRNETHATPAVQISKNAQYIIIVISIILFIITALISITILIIWVIERKKRKSGYEEVSTEEVELLNENKESFPKSGINRFSMPNVSEEDEIVDLTARQRTREDSF